MRWLMIGAAALGFVEQGTSGIALPSRFTRAYEGQIAGKLPVRLTLTKNGQQVTGSYVYTRVGKPLKLQGTIDGEGRFKLDEFDAARQKTGGFEGTFTGPTRMEGSWSGPKTKEPLHFFAYEGFTKPTHATGPFTGSWGLGGPDEGPGFTLDLYQRGNKIEGLYHAITRNATRLDTDSPVEGTVRGNRADVRWTSGYSAVKGTAVLTLNGRTLSWRIPHPPTGEYWAPEKATLHRSKVK